MTTVRDTFDEQLSPELWGGKPQPGRRLTEDEYLAWCDEDTRAEWVDGEVVIHMPATLKHGLLVKFFLMLIEFVVQRHGTGLVVGSEYAARILPGRRWRVPDVLYVSEARLGLLQRTHLAGAPDLAIEIVSDDSETRDREEKFDEYRQAGVREYWIVDPRIERLEPYALDAAGQYVPIPLREGYYHSSVIAGLRVKPEWLWREPQPDPFAALKELGLL